MAKSRLLFVDVIPQSLEMLRQSLRGLHRRWDIRFASAVDQARCMLDDESFDAIVLAMHLPARKGFRLLRRIRADKRTCDIPVVVLTTAEASDLKRQALTLGATDLLATPIRREDLIVRLTSALALKKRQDEIKSLNEALEQKVRRRTAELERSRLDVIWRLAKVGEYRDEETGNHIVRVGRYCHTLAAKLGLPREQVEDVALAAPLHDIGKVGIPDRILLKPGRLTPAEWATLETHCVIGSEILLQEPKGLYGLRDGDATDEPVATGNRVVQLAASIALTHHERWDGRGYPLALRGKDIPLASRLVAVADVYDALRSVRPYKADCPHEKTLDLMAKERGRHFDPDVYDAFRQLSDQFRSIRLEYSDDDADITRIQALKPVHKAEGHA